MYSSLTTPSDYLHKIIDHVDEKKGRYGKFIIYCMIGQMKAFRTYCFETAWQNERFLVDLTGIPAT